MKDNLFGSNVFSVLDLKSAYVPFRQQDKHKTAIIVKSGWYEFNYLPFGLKSALATFMRFIHEVLYSQAPELKNLTEVYLDDILIRAPDVAIHKVVLEKVCQCLSHYNLGINLPKCVLGQPSLNYLGYQISAEGYTATDEKVKAINDYPIPSNLRQLYKFYGMINFYHKAIENCSILLKPLYDILKQNRKKTNSAAIFWTQEQKNSLQKVKSALSKISVLSYPIPNALTFLASDAMDSSIASTIYQLHPTKKIRVPLALFSKNLQKPQSNYSIFDKEILALYSSIKYFQFMLENRPFTIP